MQFKKKLFVWGKTAHTFSCVTGGVCTVSLSDCPWTPAEQMNHEQLKSAWRDLSIIIGTISS